MHDLMFLKTWMSSLMWKNQSGQPEALPETKPNQHLVSILEYLAQHRPHHSLENLDKKP